MDIDLTRLRHILAISRTRNFSRAAEELNITQPALSRSVAAFEQRCGFRLFDRSRSGVVPTAMGKLVIAEAENVLRAARNLDHNLKLYAGAAAGEVSIGLGPLMASLLLPSLGRHLLRSRPGVQLRTSIRSPEQLVRELLEDRIEVIFGNSWTISHVPDLVISALGSIPMAIIVRVEHPLAGATGLTVADVQGYPVASASQLPAIGLSGDAGAFICDNYHILRELVLDTDCIWLCSTALAGQDIAEGKMFELALADFQPFYSDISMVHQRGRTLSPAAMMIADHVRRMLSTMGAGSKQGQ